jgi:chloramphenicol-sensitive protein RarD
MFLFEEKRYIETGNEHSVSYGRRRSRSCSTIYIEAACNLCAAFLVKKNKMNHKKGIWYAIVAYASWGLLPVYWKLLRHVPPVQLLSHRIIWSFFALLAVLIVLRRWRSFRKAAFTLPIVKVYFIAALLIGINWGTYVWAVNTGHLVETSLGYFINPLLSVLMGVVFFRERLRRRQWIPIVLALLGVVYLSVIFGSLPWIALVLALSFGLYGAVKKIAPLNSLYGLIMETGILFLPALLFLAWSDSSGTGVFLHAGNLSDVLLVGAGLTTTIPLLLFASAARKIPLSLIGILQYISPTLQFFLGVCVYGEPFSLLQFIGYSIVWIALILFGLEGYISYRASAAAAEMGQD